MALQDNQEIYNAYERLFRNFRDDEGEFKYTNLINRMTRDDNRSLVIEYEDLILMDDMFESDLADTLLVYPQRMLEVGSDVLKEHIRNENPDYFQQVRDEKFFVRFNNLPTEINIRDIRAENVDELRWLEGIIIRTTEIKSIIDEAVFICQENSEHIIQMPLHDGVFTRPQFCSVETCKSKSFQLDQKSSKMVDWQFITLQERPEDLPPGASPKSVPCQLTYDLVNAVRPGDRVVVGGIVRSRPTKSIRKGQLLTFDIWIEVNFVESSTKEDEFTDISPEEEREFLDMSRDPKIFDRLLESLAPAIHGMTEVKQASLLMLFAGVDKTFPDGFTTRGQPNVLLVGDPGVAKSQLLRYVQAIAPRGLYTSGKGSSAAGLTAAIIREPETGEITLEAGALVLADRGVCLIDEFDKMNENDRSAIHEAMEQHSYHPSTEITFADGSVHEIGKFVDDLFDKNEDKVVDGINCEILPLSKESKINSTDFNSVYPINIDRISRHKAPKYFYKIQFGNGRTVIVTPNHPLFVYDHGITTLDASEIEKNMFVPAPREISFHKSDLSLNVGFNSGNKKVNLPQKITKPLAHFLGYMVSEVYSYAGSSAEIGLKNSDSSFIDHMAEVIKSSFQINLLNYSEENKTIKIASRKIFDYLQGNFPELIVECYDRRIPRIIFGCPKHFRVAFLRSAFTGDGLVETEACYYSTNSERLASDYQDLLLTLGIHSRICKEKYWYKAGTKLRYRYKVYIHGDSLKRFLSIVISNNVNKKLNKSRSMLNDLILKSKRTSRKTDCLPGEVATIINDCLVMLGMKQDEYFYQHIENDNSISIDVVKKYIEKIKSRFDELHAKQLDSEIRKLSPTARFSQILVGTIGGISKNNIDYYGSRGNSEDTTIQLISQVKNGHASILGDVKAKINYLEKLCKFRWLRVTNIQKLPNNGRYKTDWVYDVTIEPTRSFISQGVVLHNTVSVAKAGIVATLNARTGVMAAANPRYGRYEDHRTFNENVNLPPTILSRFDLIFVIRDTPKEEEDSILANHIINLHRFHGSGESVKPSLTEDQLKKYIAFSKKNYHPTLSAEAAELIETFYVNMRNRYATSGESPQDRITITARQLEGIIRLSEAKARAALRSEVTKSDAQFAIDLVKHSLQHIATDPETGALDIDAFYSGQTSSRRSKLNKLLSVIDFVYRDVGGKFKEDRLIEAAKSEGLSEDYIKGAIRQMLRDGTLYQPRVGYLDKP